MALVLARDFASSKSALVPQLSWVEITFSCESLTEQVMHLVQEVITDNTKNNETSNLIFCRS